MEVGGGGAVISLYQGRLAPYLLPTLLQSSTPAVAVYAEKTKSPSGYYLSSVDNIWQVRLFAIWNI